MTIASYLDNQLKLAGIPIVGVSVGDDADRSTWTVRFAPGATDAQKAQAATILATADPTQLADADIQGRLDDKIIKALIVWQAQLHGITVAAAKAQLLTIYKALP